MKVYVVFVRDLQTNSDTLLKIHKREVDAIRSATELNNALMKSQVANTSMIHHYEEYKVLEN